MWKYIWIDLVHICICLNSSFQSNPLPDTPSNSCSCQGMTCFPLQSCLGVLPTPTLDTFGISRTLTTSQFWRRFKELPILSPFQQPPTLPHAPSIPTPRLTPPPKAAPRVPPPPKVTWRPLRIPHPPIQSPV